MFLRGNGKQTLEELVYHDIRARYYYHQLKEEYSDTWTSILEK
jgi:hypothetical protein